MSNTVFSYAQAAKRHTAPQSSLQTASNMTPAFANSQAKEEVPPSNSSVSAPSIASNDVDSRDSGSISQHASEAGALKQEPEVEFPVSAMQNAKGARESGVVAVQSPQTYDDKVSRSTSRTSRSNESGEGKKGRKGKKGRGSENNGDSEVDAQEQEKEKEKENPEEEIKPVFIEASPPLVNIWKQRAQASKTKPVTVPTPNVAPAIQSAPTSVSESKTRQPTEDATSSRINSGGGGDEKTYRKSAESAQVVEEPRKNGSRGGRPSGRDEKATVPSPIITDVSSFPDLKSATVNGEPGRRAQDKTDRTEKETQEESNSAKRQKEKWVPMDFVPTAVFATPIPPRNPKPRGGARGGREAGSTRGGGHHTPTGTGAASGPGDMNDKAASTNGAQAAKSVDPRPRENTSSVRVPSGSANSGKRFSIDGTPTKDQRRSSAITSGERHRESVADSLPVSLPTSRASGSGEPRPFRRSSNKSTLQSSNGKTDGPRGGRGEVTRAINSEPLLSDRQSNFVARGSEYAKDVHGQGYSSQVYPKSESRPERGRGGYRRGGHNGPASHIQQAGYPANSQYPGHPPVNGRHAGPYSPPPFQGPYSHPYTGGPSRGSGRGNGRVNSTTSRSSSNGASYGAKVPQVTAANHLDYGNMAPVATYTYTGPFDQTLPLLKSQVEYYFSVENLCKDTWLRKQMDSQGFVPLLTVCGFKRMQKLAQDVEQVRLACLQSEHLDYVVGDDGVERLRMRGKWEPFVLDKKEREPQAQNDGPQSFVYQSLHAHVGQFAPMVHPVAYHIPAHSTYPIFTQDEHLYQVGGYGHGSHFEPPMNGGDVNGYNHHVTDSQLSATVPEFSPIAAGPPLGSSPRLEDLTTFPDKKVEDLFMVIDPDTKGNFAGPVDAPFLPNGSGEVRAGHNADLAGQTNAARGVDAATRNGISDSPSNKIDVVWSDARASNVIPDDARVHYVTFREQALEQRRHLVQGETSGQMKALYRFWQHFLMQNFNAAMYHEFRGLALEDAKKEIPSKIGLRHLLNYYKDLLADGSLRPWGSNRPVPEIFTLHYHDAMALEPNWSMNGDVRK